MNAMNECKGWETVMEKRERIYSATTHMGCLICIRMFGGISVVKSLWMQCFLSKCMKKSEHKLVHHIGTNWNPAPQSLQQVSSPHAQLTLNLACVRTFSFSSRWGILSLNPPCDMGSMFT